MPTMRTMLKNGSVDRFFVSSDTIAVCNQLRSTFDEDTIAYIDRDCDNRSTECLKYAVADLFVLAQTNPLLGSTWSSFTEAAMRLGGPKALMAGTLFFSFTCISTVNMDGQICCNNHFFFSVLFAM